MASINKSTRPKPSPTPTTTNTTSSNTSGYLFVEKDLDDENDKMIAKISMLNDDKFAEFWRLYVVKNIKERYQASRQNVRLQTQQIEVVSYQLDCINEVQGVIQELAKREKLENKTLCVPAELYNVCFQKVKKPNVEGLVEITQEEVNKRILWLTVIIKLHKAERKKSIASVKVGNAIIGKRRQEASLLLFEYKTMLQNIMELNEEIIGIGDYNKLETMENGVLEETSNCEAYLDTCKNAKKNYAYYNMCITIMINESYRM